MIGIVIKSIDIDSIDITIKESQKKELIPKRIIVYYDIYFDTRTSHSGQILLDYEDCISFAVIKEQIKEGIINAVKEQENS